MHIVVKPERLAAYGLTITDLINILKAENINISAGTLGLGRRDYRIRSVAEFKSPEDIKNIVIRSTGLQRISVADLAEVSFGYEKLTNAMLNRGKEGIAIGVKPEPDANILELSDRLEEIVKQGDLGRILNFFCYRLGAGAGLGGEEYWPGWRTDPRFACGMTVESLSHDLDMLLALAGEVADVRANLLGTRDDLPDFDNNVNVVMNLVNGGTALIHASWASYLSGSSRGVLGLDGSVAMEGNDIWNFDIVRLRTKEMQREIIERFDDKFDEKSYLAENRYFADCVEKAVKPRINEHNGYKTVRISQAILRSHRERIVVSLV